MAIFHFSVGVVQRSSGQSVVAVAARRSGARLYDNRLGRTHLPYPGRAPVHSEILLPDGAPERWRDRATLWNEVEAGELRKDAALARVIEVALPRELCLSEAIILVRDFARQEFVESGMVADLNVHLGVASDGEAQPHAQILLTLRRIANGDFGTKERAWNDRRLLQAWRKAWADRVNARLAEAGIAARVDHRSNFERGIDLEPQNKIGAAAARRAAAGESMERVEEHAAIARRNAARLAGGTGAEP